MPVEFLSDEQAAVFGRFDGPPTTEQLERFFWLTDSDRSLVAKRRREDTALGFAIQLGTVRFLGTFLEDVLDIPWSIVVFVAEQLNIVDPSCVKRYTIRPKTSLEHQWEIRRAYGYSDFSERVEDLREVIHARAWLANEGPLALFDRATAWCVEHKVLLPGASTMARLVAELRADALERLWTTIYDQTGDSLRRRLDGLLVVPEGSRSSEFDRLRAGPMRINAREMAKSLERLAEIREMDTRAIDVKGIPAARLASLARYGMSAHAQSLRRMTTTRRTATLLATMRQLEIRAADDVLELFEFLYASNIDARAQRSADREKLTNVPRLSRAAGQLASVVRVLLDPPNAGQLNLTVVRKALSNRDLLLAALRVIDELAPDDDDNEGVKRAALVRRFATVRSFWARFVDVVPLEATKAGQPVLAAARGIPALFARKRIHVSDVDASLLAGSWRRLVLSDDGDRELIVDKRAYTLAVTEAFHTAVRRKDIFAAGPGRFGDPRAKLMSSAAWAIEQPVVLAALQLPADPDHHLDGLAQALDTAYRMVATRFSDNESASVEGGRVHLGKLAPQEEPASLAALRALVDAMVPAVDLPDLIMEVHGWTRCLDAYSHISEAEARMDNLPMSVAACLVAEATNIGYTPVTSPATPALTKRRLSHVEQNFIRSETHRSANALLIEYQSNIGLARVWGGGLVASVDGMRFVVPVASVNTGPNPRYFGRGRGITLLNVVNDQTIGIGSVVVPGTIRDSLFILDTLLDIDGGPRPEQVITDTASYSDQVFGLFSLLGFQFSPRLADLPDQRWWRIDRHADYGPLNQVARNRVNIELIRTNWDDILHLAGSLMTHTVKASEVMRVTQGDGRPTTLGRALAEYGRISKTMHLLTWIDNPAYRRSIGVRLNVQEGRHSLARKVCHGQKGEIRQRYREGQEDQLAALGLVVNMITLWNTTYMDLALAHLRSIAYPVSDDDVARLSPLGYAHVNFHGHYAFSNPPTELRPLRDPKDADPT